MTSQEYFTSSCDVLMPKLVYGTAWKKERTQGLVEEALRCGFRGIDTACQPKHYHEPGVGDALKSFFDGGGKRGDLFLQTKFTPVDGQDPQTIPYDSSKSLTDQVKESCEISLKNLGTSYIDSLVLHSPLPDPEDFLEVWQSMEDLFEQGKVKQLGISNIYNLKLLNYLYHHSKIQPAVVQNRFYEAQNYDQKIRGFCRENNIVYQSFWTLTANPHLLESRTMQSISRKNDKTPAQILFRYLNQRNVLPLTGTTSKKYMSEDLQIFNFNLDEADLVGIDGLLR